MRCSSTKPKSFRTRPRLTALSRKAGWPTTGCTRRRHLQSLNWRPPTLIWSRPSSRAPCSPISTRRDGRGHLITIAISTIIETERDDRAAPPRQLVTRPILADLPIATGTMAMALALHRLPLLRRHRETTMAMVYPSHRLVPRHRHQLVLLRQRQPVEAAHHRTLPLLPRSDQHLGPYPLLALPLVVMNILNVSRSSS